MSIVSVDNIQPIGSGTTVTVNKSVTLESGNTNITGVCTATSFSGSGANLTSLPAANLTGTLPAISGANLTSLPSQVTIGNAGSSRLITSGGGTTLNGESNLTFSSNQLTVHEAKLKGNQLLFTTSGTAYLDHSTVGQDIQVRVSTSSSNDTTGPTFKSNGNLAFASGKGIDFSATANVGGTSSELLDDYEEGSYTPEFSSGFSAISYHNPRVGYYTRIGNLCHFSIYMYVYQATGDGNQVRITLPFTSSSGSARESGCYTVYSNGLMSNASNEISHCTYLIGQNYSYIRPCKVTNGTVINGNNTRLGQGANNQYLILAGQMFV